MLRPVLRGSLVTGALALVAGSAGVLVPEANAAPRAGAQARAPGHFKCYRVTPKEFRRTVTLTDQFERKRTLVLDLVTLCNPVQKNAERIRERRAHLACYRIQDAPGQPGFRRKVVRVRNQFGVEVLIVERGRTLCVPSLKALGSGPPPATPNPSTLVDDFKCYDVRPSAFAPRRVSLRDQFGQGPARVLRPEALCAPVRKDREPLRQRLVHLKCYAIEEEEAFSRRVVTVRNQFGVETLNVVRPETLCVPSTKRRIPPGRFGARCRPKLRIFHGGAGVFQIIPNPGSAPILSSGLASSQPGNTPFYRITKNAAPPHSFTFRSKKVDPPPRVVLYIVRIRVRFGTPGNIVASIIVKCEVRVVHTGRRFGARCTKLTIKHGQSGIFQIIPVPGSAPILSSGLASSTPGNTPSRSVTKLGGQPPHRFRYRSKKIDPPPRTVLEIVRIRVRFGTPGNVIANVIVKCEVRVIHDGHNLTVTTGGDGSGRVTSEPRGIDCPPTCTSFFDVSVEVTLTPAPDSTSLFTGWSGACTGTGACTVRMDADREVTARFDRRPFTLTVSRVGTGDGQVQGPGISCGPGPGGDCSESYAPGTAVSLLCNPIPGSTCTFTSGCDSLPQPNGCSLTMNADRTVTCDFARAGPVRQWSFLDSLRSLFSLG